MWGLPLARGRYWGKQQIALASEERCYHSAIFGRIGAKIWTAVVTYREENIRIISVRRARKREVELYEGSRF
ncbi:BrnT family toxin [Synechococcus sp. PCC 7336]|uniref:BrnT family toxin n=1 Tax=Synechococcus sp. PCC 7336 TaxID=195250 RepID=UPI00035CB5B5